MVISSIAEQTDLRAVNGIDRRVGHRFLHRGRGRIGELFRKPWFQPLNFHSCLQRLCRASQCGLA